MMSDSTSAHGEPRLESFFDRVVALHEAQRALDPDAFLSEVARLRPELDALRQRLSEAELQARFDEFARHRFELVDSGDEYAEAAGEVLVLSMVASDAPQLCTRALQQSAVALSSVLAEEGAVAQFGNVLRRLRQIAQQTDDAELKAWLAGVLSALPDGTAPEEPSS